MKRKAKRITINKRVGIVAGIEGGLAQLGYFTRLVQRVVRRWPRVPHKFVHEYFFAVAQAAMWNTDEINLRVYTRAHWPLVWELAAACEKVRQIPKTHPAYWLLRMNINVTGNVDFTGKIRSTIRSDFWGEISQEIERRGGDDFSPTTLRQHAKRLGLVPPAAMQKEARRLFSVA